MGCSGNEQSALGWSSAWDSNSQNSPVLPTSCRTLIPRTALFSVLDLCIKNWSSVLFYEQVAVIHCLINCELGSINQIYQFVLVF